MISVIMVTYNHQDFILDAINGVVIQETDFPVELIIADDNSPDDTEKVVLNYLNNTDLPKNITINYTKHKINKGANNNFIWASQQTKGKYIALCEGDDYWTDPLKLQKQVDFLEANPEIGASFTNAIIDNHINQITFEYNKPYKLEEGVLDNRIVFNKGGGVFPTCTFIFKAELAPSFFLKELAGDEMLLFTIANNSKIAFQDFISATYNRWNNGVFSSIINNSKKLIEFRKKEINGYKKLLHLLHDTNKVYLKTKMKKIALHVIRSNKYSISNLKYIRFVGVKTFIKIYLDDLR